MSNTALTWAFNQDLRGAQKAVLLVLADYADENASCYPGVPRIAYRAGTSDRNARRAIGELEAAGYLKTSARERFNGSATSNRYFLDLTFGVQKDPMGKEQNEIVEPDGARRLDETPLTSRQDPPDMVSGAPCHGVRAMNPKKNHEKNLLPSAPEDEPAEDSKEIKEEKKPRTTKGASGPFQYPEDFKQFWANYPRKVDKKDAYASWTKALETGVAPELVISKATDYAQECQIKGTETQYIRHPKTWLNKEGWESDYIKPKTTSPAFDPWNPQNYQQ